MDDTLDVSRDEERYTLPFSEDQKQLTLNALDFLVGMADHAADRPKIEEVRTLVHEAEGPVTLSYHQIKVLDAAYLALQGEVEEIAGWKASGDLRRQFEELHEIIDAPFV